MGQGEGVKRSSGSVVPAVIICFFALIQLIFTAIIVGLEAGSVSYDAGRGTVYAGFWCAFVFSVTCLWMFGSICCGKSVGYRVFLILLNILSLAFAIILIAFTARFKDDPCLCYGILCEVPSWECIRNEQCIDTTFGGVTYYCTQRTLDKVPILKTLLAFAILMLISNVVFILVTIVLIINQRRKKSTPHKIPEPIPQRIQSTAPNNDGNAYEPGSRPQSFAEPTHYYYSDNNIPFQHVQPSAPMNIRSQKF